MSIPVPANPGTPTLDPQNPWPGLQAFTEREQAFFFGRHDELDELARLVRREIITVLFGRSGLGKTSLLQAGLFPLLRDEQFLPVSLRLDFSLGTGPLVTQVKALVREAFHAQAVEAPEPREEETLWEFFHRAQIWNEKNRLLTPLLVFDQFEEIFTLGRGDDRVKPFLVGISDLIENRIPATVRARLDQNDEDLPFSYDRQTFRVILSLREDFLPHLDDLRTLIPSLTKSHFRLNRMNGTQGLEAILKPGGAIVGQTVALGILRFIAGGREERTTTAPVDLKDMVVEPALLSLFCRELNEKRLAMGLPEITSELVEGERSTILSGFYERSLSDLPRPVRSFIEDRLLTTSGFRRGEALEDALAVQGVTHESLTTLVNRRLLRVEQRLGTHQVELIHDVLTGVILESREERRRKQHRRKLRRRISAIAAAAVALLIVVLLYGFSAVRRQKEASAERKRFEELIEFTLFDIRDEFQHEGKLELLAQSQRRVLAYVEKESTRGQSDNWMRMKGVLYNNLGDVYRQQMNSSQALKSYQRALPIFKMLVKKDPSNTMWNRDLELTHGNLVEVLVEQGKESDAISHAKEALEITDHLIEGEPNSKDFQLANSLRHLELGRLLLNNGKPDEGLEHLRKSSALVELEGRGKTISREMRLALVGMHNALGSAERTYGRADQALEHHRQAVGLVSEILRMDPRDIPLQQQVAICLVAQGDSTSAAGDSRTAIESYAKAYDLLKALTNASDPSSDLQFLSIEVMANSAEDFFNLGDMEGSSKASKLAFESSRELARRDPANLISLRALAITNISQGEILSAKDQPEKALPHFQESLRILTPLQHQSPSDTDLKNWIAWTHFLVGNAHSQRRDIAEARKEWIESLRLVEPMAMGSKNADLLDNYARLLIVLGRKEEARPICLQLASRGWNWRKFQELCRRNGLLPTKMQSPPPANGPTSP